MRKKVGGGLQGLGPEDWVTPSVPLESLAQRQTTAMEEA